MGSFKGFYKGSFKGIYRVLGLGLRVSGCRVLGFRFGVLGFRGLGL